MPQYILLMTSNPKPGQDEAYQDWYDNQHLADVCRIPGITGGRRYVADEAVQMTTVGRNLAMYDLDTDDPAAVIAELRRRAGGAQMPLSPAFDSTSLQMSLFRRRE